MELNSRVPVNKVSTLKKHRRAMWIIALFSLLYVNLILFLFGGQQIAAHGVLNNPPTHALSTEIVGNDDNSPF